MIRYIRSFSTSATRAMPFSRKRAAILLVGNELLSGKTMDTNGNFLAKQLFRIGLDLKRVEVIPDEKPDIAQTVLNLSSKHDVVFTSGGIGPTHDDITYESIAAAFQLPLEYHDETLERMRVYFAAKNSPLTDGRKRMALLPQIREPFSKVSYAAPAWSSPSAISGASAARTTTTTTATTTATTTSSPPVHPPLAWVPIVSVKNVHIFPGVPRLFESLVSEFIRTQLEPHIQQTPLTRRSLGVFMAEGDLADSLRAIQLACPLVNIGSYPKWVEGTPTKETVRVVITLEGIDAEEVQRGVHMVKEKLPVVEL